MAFRVGKTFLFSSILLTLVASRGPSKTMGQNDSELVLTYDRWASGQQVRESHLMERESPFQTPEGTILRGRALRPGMEILLSDGSRGTVVGTDPAAVETAEAPVHGGYRVRAIVHYDSSDLVRVQTS